MRETDRKDNKRDLEIAWRQSARRKRVWTRRWVWDDLLGIQFKSVIYMVFGAAFCVLALCGLGPWWMSLVGLGCFLAGLFLFIWFRRGQYRGSRSN